eukprot:SAG31_NODE_1945_length_6853_cov_4.546491_4_plen_485_part_00
MISVTASFYKTRQMDHGAEWVVQNSNCGQEDDYITGWGTKACCDPFLDAEDFFDNISCRAEVNETECAVNVVVPSPSSLETQAATLYRGYLDRMREDKERARESADKAAADFFQAFNAEPRDGAAIVSAITKVEPAVIAGFVDSKLIDAVANEVMQLQLSQMDDQRPWGKARHCIRSAIQKAKGNSMPRLARDNASSGCHSPRQRPITSPPQRQTTRSESAGDQMTSPANAYESSRKTVILLNDKSSRHLDAKAIRHLELKAKSRLVHQRVYKPRSSKNCGCEESPKRQSKMVTLQQSTRPATSPLPALLEPTASVANTSSSNTDEHCSDSRPASLRIAPSHKHGADMARNRFGSNALAVALPRVTSFLDQGSFPGSVPRSGHSNTSVSRSSDDAVANGNEAARPICLRHVCSDSTITGTATGTSNQKRWGPAPAPMPPTAAAKIIREVTDSDRIDSFLSERGMVSRSGRVKGKAQQTKCRAKN